MIKRPLVSLSTLGLALGLLAAQPAMADSVTAIAPSSPSVTLGRDGSATMNFTVSGTAAPSETCGIWINYGDGDSPDTRVISRQDGLLPRSFAHTFKRVGQFAVVAKGERVKTVPACAGQATTTINVLAAGGGRRDAAAACPDGWSLVQGSFVRQTGAFTCAPLLPANRMDCGPGLRYFENNNTIGCRVRGQGRDRDR